MRKYELIVYGLFFLILLIEDLFPGILSVIFGRIIP
jgi:hypothetical protein